MISKKYEYEKIKNIYRKYYYEYFKCYYIFKKLIYKKQIGFDEFIENGGVIC